MPNEAKSLGSPRGGAGPSGKDALLRDLSGHFRQAAELLARPAPDYGNAFKSLQAAAEQGVVAAQLDLAHLLRQGLGIGKDEAQAQHWYQEAAQRGCRRAQVHLAVTYQKGEGSQPDPLEAAYWYTRAAEHGDRVAMGNLGIMYALGIGVAQDIVEAFLWLTSAVGMGNEAVRKAQEWAQSCLREEVPPADPPGGLKAGMQEEPACDLCLAGTCDTVECQDEAAPFLIPLTL